MRLAEQYRREIQEGRGHDPARPSRPENRDSLQQLLIPVLIVCLADQDDDVQAAAASALARTGHLGLLDLLTALLNPDARVAKGAQLAITQVGDYFPPDAAGALDCGNLMPALTKSLTHQDRAMRAAGFRLFAQLRCGAASEGAVAALKAGLSDPDAQIRRHAAAALARLEH